MINNNLVHVYYFIISDAREWRQSLSPISHVRFGGDFQRTVVFIYYKVKAGEGLDLFLRGGAKHNEQRSDRKTFAK